VLVLLAAGSAQAGPVVGGEARAGAGVWVDELGREGLGGELTWGGQLRLDAAVFGVEANLRLTPERDFPPSVDAVFGGVFQMTPSARMQGEGRIGIGASFVPDALIEQLRFGGAFALFWTPMHNRAAVGAYIQTMWRVPAGPDLEATLGIRFLVGNLRCGCTP